MAGLSVSRPWKGVAIVLLACAVVAGCTSKSDLSTTADAPAGTSMRQPSVHPGLADFATKTHAAMQTAGTATKDLGNGVSATTAITAQGSTVFATYTVTGQANEGQVAASLQGNSSVFDSDATQLLNDARAVEASALVTVQVLGATGTVLFAKTFGQ